MNKLEKAIDKIQEIQSFLEYFYGRLSDEGWDNTALNLIEDCKEAIKDFREFRKENDLEVKENYTDDMNPKSYHGCALEIDPKDSRQKEWQLQRFEKGFDDTEIWSLDSTIIKFIVPRLKAYLEEDKKLRSLENHCWTDKEKEEIKSYQKEICEMIEIFEKYKPPLYNDNLIEFEKAFMKFAKIFPTLWT